jgi:putative membrane-bound dehydrogenase-like protein
MFTTFQGQKKDAMTIRDLTILYLLPHLFLFSCKPALYDEAKTPEETLASFDLADGFEIDVFAAEPQVLDPVEMLFDDQGRIFVVEMPDYPFMPELDQGAGRIVQLHDADQDGHIDGRTIFLDSITEATSILPWQDGFLVTAAPYIYFISDSDQDGKADKKELVFSGFFEKNSEAQITNLKYNIDNWIYAANNGQAGEITFLKDGASKRLNVAGADFRFRMDRGEFECASGPAQFGHAINLEGHRFITQNTLHIRHTVIPWRYLHRHDFLPSTNVALNISDHDLEMFQRTPPPYWRAERTRRRQIQYKEQNLDRQEYAEDHFTGSSGGTFYAGDAFPQEYIGSIFTGDVSGNLIHRDILEPLKDSPTYVAKRSAKESAKEFLSSTDSWFRPANLTVGPDGYLYVIDMYRQHIETPLSIPEDLKEDMDFLYGETMGRIYRIRPTGSEIKTATPNLKQMTSAQLVNLLEHPNRWQRINAQRLLVERQDASTIEPLTILFNTHKNSATRLHAFYTLEGLGQMDLSKIEKALTDPYPGLREHALILAERYPESLPMVVKAITDDNARVAFQAVLSLGQYENEHVVSALTKSLRQHYSDPWFRMAVLSAPQGSTPGFLVQLLDGGFLTENDNEKLAFLSDLSYIIGYRGSEAEIKELSTTLLSDDGNVTAGITNDAIEGLIKGIIKNNKPLMLPEALTTWLDKMKAETTWEPLLKDLNKLTDPI